MTEINYRNFVIALNNPHYKPPQPPPWVKEKSKESSKTTEEARTMKIQDLLKQAKPCWKYAAMDSDFSWYLFTDKPFPHEAGVWMNRGEGCVTNVGEAFDIDPFDGDWKDSLICREEINK